MLTRSLCVFAFAQCLTNLSVALHHKKLCALSNTRKTIFTFSYRRSVFHISYANAQTANHSVLYRMNSVMPRYAGQVGPCSTPV